MRVYAIFLSAIHPPLGAGAILTGLLMCLPLGSWGTKGLSGMADAVDWSESKAEILQYEVEKMFMGRELVFPAWIITDVKHFDAGNNRLFRGKKGGTIPVFQVSIHYSYIRRHFNRHHYINMILGRSPGLPLLKEEVVVHDWESRFSRTFSTESGVPTLNLNSLRQGKSVFSFEKKPVLSTEQLFFYVRSLPLDKNYCEKIWLLENLLEDVVKPYPVFAEISVKPEVEFILEKSTKHITVDCGPAGVLDFWIMASGLHQVVMARLADGTLFKLKKISKKKYWRF